MFELRIQCLAFLVLALATVASGQSERFRVSGDAPTDAFGTGLDGGADANADGVPDCVIGAPASSFLVREGGAVRLVSGRDGGVLLVVDGDQPFGHLGTTVAFVGDLDFDGRADFAAGDEIFTGDPFWKKARARVFSSRDGRVIREWVHALRAESTPAAGVVGAAGDVDADGIADVIVAWPPRLPPVLGELRIEVYSGATGNVVMELPSELEGKGFLSSEVECFGDLDNDGHADVAHERAVTFLYYSHSARIYSGQSGALLKLVSPSVFGESYRSIEPAGDIDLDGTGDIAVGVQGGLALLPAVYVFSGVSNDIHHFFMPGYPSFGEALAAGIELDGDGVPDLAVSAPAAAADAGHVYFYSGATGTEFAAFASTGGETGFGSVLAAAGDQDGDGRAEIVLHTSSSSGGASANQAAVLSAVGTPTSGVIGEYGAGCGLQLLHVPHLQFTGRPATGAAVALSLTSVTGTPAALLFAGTAPAALPIGSTGCTLLVADPLLLLPAWHVESSGSGSGFAALSGTIPVGLAGAHLVFQAFLPPAPGTVAFETSNGIDVRLE